MSLAYLILGGNRGNTKQIFSDAIDLVSSHIGPISAKSSLYSSESWGFESDLFMNQVIKLETLLSPAEVLRNALDIENQLGRIRKTGGYEARTLDIDLLYFDSLIIRTEELIVPHPRIKERRFVLVPLAEVAPDLIDPVTGQSVSEMLLNCQDPSKVWLSDEK